MPNLFFFYGSLRSGYWNNRIISNKSRLIGPAETLQGFDLYVGRHGPVPCVVPNPKGNTLKGELWKLSEDDMRRVRGLEAGYDEGSFRVQVAEHKGIPESERDAFIYHRKSVERAPYIGHDPILVESGDYADAVDPNRGRIISNKPSKTIKIEVA